MRLFIVFTFFILSLSVSGQKNPIIVVLKDSRVDSTFLGTVSEDAVNVSNGGTIKFKEISKIYFVGNYNSRLENIYTLLKNEGISVENIDDSFDTSKWGMWSPPHYSEGYIQGVPLSQINVEYVQIVGTSVFFSSKVTIEFEFGQKSTLFSYPVVTDQNGKPLKFYSMIGALNFMVKNGFEYVDAYALTVDKSNVYHYLLKKKS